MNGIPMRMKKYTEICNAFDIVLVPFPFTEMINNKRRPALVLSSTKQFNDRAGASVMAMITSAVHNPWPLDVEILDLKSAGLPVKSIIRMKLFTLDHRLILKKLGTLGEKDRDNLGQNLKLMVSL